MMLAPLAHRRPFAALVLPLLLAGAAAAEEPPHRRIDNLIAAGTPNFDKLAAPLASDEEFLRRIYLDLTGTVPTADDARAFLKDAAPDKRQRLIDRLLDSPEYARHMAHVFDVLLMERRRAKNVPAAVWHEYLRESFAANKPWDQLVREMLEADGTDPKNRGPARFYLDRDGEPNEITRDVTRLFLGMDLQCAQCHDHPIVLDYHQADYYGIFAFLNRSSVAKDPKLKLTVLAEKADGEATYQSVFDPKKVTKTSPPRVPGRPAIKEPEFKKGEAYKVKPKKNVPGVPKFSRRALLGGELARADNPAFTRNFANRIWALMTGRGLVHPPDLHHADNPPSHPELLNLLADKAAEHKFDIRWLIREIALSQTYQRSSIAPAGIEEIPETSFAVANLKPLAPEAMAFSLFQATGMADVERAALGKKLTEATLYARASKRVAPIIRTFAGQAGTPEEFEPTLDQALFLANDPLLRTWLTPRAGNLLDRLSKIKDDGAAIEELYLSVLTRLPADGERKEVLAYLKTPGKDRTAALRELAWALLTSAEFRFNH